MPANRYAEDRHPTSACVDFMRRTLEEDIGELSIITDLDRAVPKLGQKYAKVTSDSGTRFPSMTEFRAENWGPWQNAIEEQVQNASRDQIVTYFAEAYGVRSASDCPVCAS